MEKKKIINIVNLFNGNVETFEDTKQMEYYIKLCVEREVPITIRYGYKYVN